MGILQLNALRKEFSSLVAVDDVSFEADSGQVIGLIGPNGAGKTTLLRMLATLLPPTDGTAVICGADLRKKPLLIRRSIGYLPDFFNLYPDLTLRECLDFFARAYHIPSSEVAGRVEAALKTVALDSKKHSLIRHLSRGMVQRLGLATLLVREPTVFLLDEPASGLDPMARIQLRDILRRLAREGKTIIISSHILSELAGFCTHLAIMNRGQLVMYGSVEDIEQQIAGQQAVRVKVLGEATQAEAVLREIEGIEIKTADDGTFTLICPGGPEAVAQVNRRLVAADIPVVELARQKTSLEDLFMTLSVEKNMHIS
ncbi:MAG TPA: ABC transporter ATP-binding protein [Phycisphaerales bacterium]|nr:ABC transporter ATP-binding protein [Phycisphaerales bacterium]